MKREKSLLKKSLCDIAGLAVPLALAAFGVIANHAGRAEASSVHSGREINLVDYEKRKAEENAIQQTEYLLDKLGDNLNSIERKFRLQKDAEESEKREAQKKNEKKLYAKAQPEKLSIKVYAEGPEFPNVTYQKRFEEFEDLFEKYGSNPPRGMNETDYTALLIAIAERESSMGYPRGRKKREQAFTGYASGKRNNKNAEDQLSATADTLKYALEGNHPYYPKAGNLAGRERMLYVLEVYNMGDKATGDNKKAAQDYARDVYSSYGKWKNLFTAD